MKKEFVTYEIALALKELGFNKPCFGYYNKSWSTPNELLFPQYAGELESWNEMVHLCSAPLWQQTIEFLKQYKILVREQLGSNEFFWEVLCPYNINYCFDDKERAILKAIDLIKKI